MLTLNSPSSVPQPTQSMSSSLIASALASAASMSMPPQAGLVAICIAALKLATLLNIAGCVSAMARAWPAPRSRRSPTSVAGERNVRQPEVTATRPVASQIGSTFEEPACE